MAKFLSVGFGSFASSQFHSHHCSEISIYTAGRGEAFIGEEICSFESGTIILYPPVKPHRERSRRGYSEFWIQVERLDLEGLPRSFQDTPQKTFERLAQLLHEEYYLSLPSSPAISQTLLDLMLVHLQRLRAEPAPHPEVSKLKHLLAQNLSNPSFDIGRSIRNLSLSPGHLKTLFKKSTSKSPSRYLLDLRLGEAKHLLRQGYSVKEAAFHVGFEDPYYFSRCFFRILGQRPSTFKPLAQD